MSYPATMQSTLNPIEVLKRQKKLILLCPLVCTVVGALLFVFYPRTYRSEAKLFLRVGRESVGIDPTATTGQTIPLHTSDRKDEVESAEAVFLSRSVAAQVVDRLGPDAILAGGDSDDRAREGNPLSLLVFKPIGLVIDLIKSVDPISDREEAMITFQRALFVAAERDAPVIMIQYHAGSPHFAQRVCQTVVDVGRQAHIRIHRNDEAHLFFEEQQERLRQQLDESLETLRSAKNAMGLTSVEQRRQTLERKYQAVALERLTVNQAIATTQARVANYEEQLKMVPERLTASERNMPNQGADLLRDRLYELQMKSMDLAARYSDTHPLVVAVNEQLREAQEVFASQAERRTETTDEINPIHRDLSLGLKKEQNELSGLKARIERLEEQGAQVLAELRTLNQHELELDRLARDSELARDKYLQYTKNIEEARIDQALESDRISNIAMVQEATLSEKPVAPSRLVTAGGTFLLAVAGTLGLVLLAERKNLTTPSSSPRRTTRQVLRRRPHERVSRRTSVPKMLDLPTTVK